MRRREAFCDNEHWGVVKWAIEQEDVSNWKNTYLFNHNVAPHTHTHKHIPVLTVGGKEDSREID